jgi:ATP-binding cassette, subfamily B, bacterial HlyB/CyaB
LQDAGRTGSTALNSGIASLVGLARFLGIPADASQIRHNLGSDKVGATELVRSARGLGLKARVVSSTWARLAGTPLPAIAEFADQTFMLVAKIAEDRVLVQDPVTGTPRMMTQAEFAPIWTGRVILVTRRASLSNLHRRFDITWFVQALKKYRRIFIETLAASFFLQVFALITPLFFQVIIDKVLVHRGLATLDVLITGMGVIAVFETILGGLRTYIFSHTTNRVDAELGARLFHHLLGLPIAYFDSRRAGDSVARVRELENIRNFLTGSALTLVLDLFFTIVFLAVMFFYSPVLTWIVMGSLPLYVGLSLGLTPAFRQRLDEKFNRGAENQAFLVESISGVQTLKSMAVEPQMQRLWEDQLAAYVSASFRVLTLANSANQIVQLISKLVTALTLFFGAYLVIQGRLTVGELVAFNMLSARVAQPVLRLAQIWQEFHQARISILRLGDILNSPPEPSFNPNHAALPSIVGHITFDNVGFRYRIDSPSILQSLSLEIPAGQVLGIVGSSGSGKSTLAKLIQRLYVPETGRVLIDGIDLAMVDAAWLRRQIGVVLQENVLFSRSVRDNIALADPALSMERVIAAAKLAGAHEFILELPNGYDTSVGERGANLSGGQRQRIAIARALIGNPRILIFDEATSALDYESEAIIQANMRGIVQGRTVVIIAHRLSTLRGADRILSVEHGRIVEDGSHHQLMQSNSRYAQLYRAQAGES